MSLVYSYLHVLDIKIQALNTVAFVLCFLLVMLKNLTSDLTSDLTSELTSEHDAYFVVMLKHLTFEQDAIFVLLVLMLFNQKCFTVTVTFIELLVLNLIACHPMDVFY